MPITIRFGGYQPARSVHSRAARILGAELERRLGKDIHFRFTESVVMEGRKSTDLLPMTEGDELDMCYIASSSLAARVPALGLFDIPFHFRERPECYAVLDGPTGAKLKDAVAASTGFGVLGFWDNGIRHISNWRHPIVHPRDCKGLIIRTLENAMHQRVFRAFGFEPVVIDVKDMAKAIGERRVDAQENPFTNIINFNMHKTHRFITMDGHFFGVAPVYCNRARYEKWPAEVRQAVNESVAIATAAQRGFAAEDDEVCLKQLLDDGVTVTHLHEFDRDAFIATVADIRAEAEKAAKI